MSLLFMPASSGAVDVSIGKPPGKMYDVGGYDLQLYCTGSGGPKVIVDTGLGSSSMEWLAIQDRVRKHARICSYDRAGYGWSDEGPGPRTAALMAKELHKLLQAAQEAPPYILVGHSFGGYIAQHFAESYANEVVGMVLVDSSHPEQTRRLQQLANLEAGDSLQQAHASSVNPVMLSQPRGNPAGNAREIGEFLNSRRKAIFAQMDELSNFAESGAQVAELRPFPEMPLIVLSRGQPVWGETPAGRAAEAQWQMLQKELAQLTNHSEQRIARHSGHHVHIDQPELVIEAITDIVRASNLQPTRNTAGID
ncbi:pimeloyl-ACP methyl ester carboxylesterase [Methylohalomonas lacus]|uniref:Pimeloyl-ACP methyl ester carboxylesterase n=1 Tax=Methylohalomonas lacus TaxID=398773 RepID=A0AAE3HIQ1_9GAMM|nr:alpha/beta hydrolase [Methylohalomonas lacus]MCS3903079.1 pimeloyl-ACP methyl ester carboxylesterase [Methylohalomonas lacus]